MSTLDQLFADALQAVTARGQRRRLIPAQMRPGGRILRDGQMLIDFSSNDYLGLSQHPALIERACAWTKDMGTGSGASRLVTGTSDAHLSVERKIAAFKGTEAALLFATGWQANATILPALFAAAPGAAVFSDRLVHASMHQGCAAAGVRQIRFRHNDLDHLEELLITRGAAAPARFILTESIFSMDGDSVDIHRLSALAHQYDAFLIVDEAHATGVSGPYGAGLSAHTPGGVDLVMGTFSKAMGSAGAYVAGSQLLCDYLVNHCGGFIFSTAPPPGNLGAIDAALDLVPDMEEERQHLALISERLRTGLHNLGMETGPSDSHIVPAMIGDAQATVDLSARLAKAGIMAAAIRPPTVPNGTSRLRLVLRATHQVADIDQLLNRIEDCR